MGRRRTVRPQPNPWREGENSVGTGAQSSFPSSVNGATSSGSLFAGDVSSGTSAKPHAFDATGQSGSGSVAPALSMAKSRAPLTILLGTVVSSIIGGICGLFSENLPILILGWFCSSLVALGFAILYTHKNTHRTIYQQQGKLPQVAYALSVGLSLAAIVFCAVQIALYVGRAW